MAVPSNTFLFTIDVDSLYTNIDTNLGLAVVNTIFQRYPDPKRPDSELLSLLQLCLQNNDFLFNDTHYLQTHGTAMGQRFAPSYANLYMSEWEREVLAKCPLQPLSSGDFSMIVLVPGHMTSLHSTLLSKYSIVTIPQLQLNPP